MMLRLKIITTSGLFLLALLLFAFVSLCVGTEFLYPHELFSPSFKSIVWEFRFPRILLAIATGGALATSGTVLQVLLKNPLADPYILGISSAAAFGATLSFIFHLPHPWISIFAFVLSLIALWLIVLAAQRVADSSSYFLLLTGVLMSFLFSSAVTLFLTFAQPFEGASLLFWLMGSLSLPLSSLSLFLILGTVIGICGFLYQHSYALNLLNLGEDHARTLGLDTARMKTIFFVGSSLLTALCVSLTGMIGFIGLIIPHVVRWGWSNDHRLTLPLNFLSGALFLLVTDTLIRTLFSQEIPIGAITALLGAPVFLGILWKKIP
ncbi:MAG: iron ABC transporter permease [Deltaproteobacteria bacterium]|nr:iron ABC transporter permease [Deltaproteobacteria bacterium]